MKRQCLDLLGVPGETNPLVFRGAECGDELLNGYFVTQVEGGSRMPQKVRVQALAQARLRVGLS